MRIKNKDAAQGGNGDEGYLNSKELLTKFQNLDLKGFKSCVSFLCKRYGSWFARNYSDMIF